MANRTAERGIVVIRGAGDIATGVAWRLRRCGFPVVMLEVPKPTFVRRTVCFGQAVYDGTTTVERITAVLVDSTHDALAMAGSGNVPILIDPEALSLPVLDPCVLVDAILAKRNIGTNLDMAPRVIALGPGFCAPAQVDAVIETNRGHSLGRVITSGSAEPNTGVPGAVLGISHDRVVRAPSNGHFAPTAEICSSVRRGDVLGYVDDQKIEAPVDGLLRGLLNGGIYVTKGYKLGDIDPRGTGVDPTLISDKALAIAGGVLEAILMAQD